MDPAEQLATVGVELDRETIRVLQQFVDLLLEANQRLNLTAIRTPEEAWSKHVCDSLALLPLLDDPSTENVADVGSGGGLPGVPLAIARPDLAVTLVDSTAKKLTAVESVIEQIGLRNVRLAAQRAEVLGNDASYREKFDVVVARAVGGLDMLLEWSSGLVRPEGQCFFYKSVAGAAAEVAGSAGVATRCRLDFDDNYCYELPGGHGTRAIAIYTKVDRLPRDLPRPPWKAKKKPLD